MQTRLDRQRQIGLNMQTGNTAFLFCLQNLSVIKQLSCMLVEQRRRDDLRTADNSVPLSIAQTFAFAELDSHTSMGSKSSISTIQI